MSELKKIKHFNVDFILDEDGTATINLSYLVSPELLTVLNRNKISAYVNVLVKSDKLRYLGQQKIDFELTDKIKEAGVNLNYKFKMIKDVVNTYLIPSSELVIQLAVIDQHTTNDKIDETIFKNICYETTISVPKE